ncbi:MAG: DUF4293 domain-containing protein [Flavobacteriales bacterium]
MLQRIQTLYLVLAGICLTLAFLMDYVVMSVDEMNYLFNVNGFVVNGIDINRFPYRIAVPLCAALSFGAIAFFKNRKTQLLLCRISYILVLAIIVLVFTNAMTFAESVGATPENISYKAGFFMPVPALVFLILAQRGIRKDEALIRSIERLR